MRIIDKDVLLDELIETVRLIGKCSDNIQRERLIGIACFITQIMEDKL